MTCEERNLPRQLIPRKLISPITHVRTLLCYLAAGPPPTARKLTDSHVDIHGLIRNYSKRLRCRTEAPRSMVLDIENVISRRERNAIISIGVRCHPRDFFLLVTAQYSQWIIGVILRCHFRSRCISASSTSLGEMILRCPSRKPVGATSIDAVLRS
jgi:hypothetical protein